MSGPTTTTVTLAQICDAIAAVLGGVTGVSQAQSYDDLTDGMNTTPTVQVYPDSWSQEYHTSGGGVTITDAVINVDLYAQARGSIGQNMAALMPVADAINAALITQQAAKPPFALAGMKRFSWSADRVSFDYGGHQYLGVRYALTVRVF